MKTRISTIMLGICLSLTLSSHSKGVTLVTENFAYSDGPLVGNGTWASHSGTPNTLLVSSGAAVVKQDNSAPEDANMSFASQNSGVVTADFVITVTAPGAMTGTDFEYFAMFYSNSSTFFSRTDIVAPNPGAGDFSIGISGNTSTAQATLPVNFSFGVAIPVSVSWDYDTGLASLTAGGSTVNSTTAVSGTSFGGFALRQSDSSSDETILVDSIVISHVPEPSAAVFLSIGLLTLLRRRR